MSFETGSNDAHDTEAPNPYVSMNDVLPRNFATTRRYPNNNSSIVTPYYHSNPLAGQGFYHQNESYGALQHPALVAAPNNMVFSQMFATPTRPMYSNSWPSTPNMHYNTTIPSQFGSQLITPPSEHMPLPHRRQNATMYENPYTSTDLRHGPYWLGGNQTGLPNGLPSAYLPFSPPGTAGHATASYLTNLSYPNTGMGYNCDCGEPDSYQMVTCMDNEHIGSGIFHMECVGLIMPQDDFICDNCTSRAFLMSLSSESEHVEVAPPPPMVQSTQSAKAPAQPAKAPAQPAKAPAQPAKAPAQPVKAPIQPANAPTQPAKAPSKGAWSAREDEMAIKIMKDIKRNNSCRRVDEIWEEMSRQLQGNGVSRTAGAIKNQWNRRLRSISGVDERATPRPDLMQTGLLKSKHEMAKSGRRKPNRLHRKRQATPTESDNEITSEYEEESE